MKYITMLVVAIVALQACSDPPPVKAHTGPYTAKDSAWYNIHHGRTIDGTSNTNVLVYIPADEDRYKATDVLWIDNRTNIIYTGNDNNHVSRVVLGDSVGHKRMLKPPQ